MPAYHNHGDLHLEVLIDTGLFTYYNHGITFRSVAL
jgi:hypothetical protein